MNLSQEGIHFEFEFEFDISRNRTKGSRSRDDHQQNTKFEILKGKRTLKPTLAGSMVRKWSTCYRCQRKKRQSVLRAVSGSLVCISCQQIEIKQMLDESAEGAMSHDFLSWLGLCLFDAVIVALYA